MYELSFNRVIALTDLVTASMKATVCQHEGLVQKEKDIDASVAFRVLYWVGHGQRF